MDVGQLKGSVVINFGSVREAEKAIKSLQGTFSSFTSESKEVVRATKEAGKANIAAAKASREYAVSEDRRQKALTQATAAEKQIMVLKRQSAAETTRGNIALNNARQALAIYRDGISRTDLSIDNLNKRYEILQRSLTRASVSTTGLNSATANARSWFRTSRAAASQFGLQLQDVAVQAQMGTHWLVIMGQQGSQLLGFFGAAGAMAGAILAIGAALAYLASSSKVAKDRTKELDESLTELDSSFNKAADGSRVLSDEIRELAKVSRASAIVELNKQLAESMVAGERAASAIGAISEETISNFRNAAEEYAVVGGQMDAVTGAGSNMERTLRTLSKELGVNRVQMTGLFDAYNRVNKEPTVENFQNLNSVLERLSSSTSENNTTFRGFAAELAEVSVKAIRAIKRGEDIREVLADLDDALKNIEADESIDNLTEQFERLVASVDPSAKELFEFRSQIKIIQAAVREGFIDENQADILVNKLNDVSEASKKAGRASKTAADEAAEYIARLKEEAETVSLSEQGLVKYTIQKLAAKDATIQNAQALIQEGQAYVATVQAAKDRIKQMEEEKKRREQLLDQIQKDYQKRQQFMQGGEVSQVMTQAIQLKSAGVDEAAIKDFMARQNKIINESAREVSSSPFGDIETLDLELAQREQMLIDYFGREQAMTTEHWKKLQENANMARPFLAIAEGAQQAADVTQQAMSLMETTNRKNSEEYKAMAMMQATIAGALAVSKIWAENPNPYYAIPMTALIAANVGAQIAAIQAANYATGGLVRGPGTGTSDDIPANLSNGEYVLRADAVRKIGVSNLNAMNQGRMANFSSGGLVGGSGAVVGNNTTVNVIDQRSRGAAIETTERVDENGNPSIEILVRDAVNASIARGDFDRTMGASYGLRRSGRRV